MGFSAQNESRKPGAAVPSTKAPTFEAIFPGTSQSVAIGASSTQSNAFQSTSSVVQLCATVACFISTGANPTAVANTSMYLPAGVVLKIGVIPGQKLAVIESASGGTLYVTEGS